MEYEEKVDEFTYCGPVVAYDPVPIVSDSFALVEPPVTRFVPEVLSVVAPMTTVCPKMKRGSFARTKIAVQITKRRPSENRSDMANEGALSVICSGAPPIVNE
jgi:hypothetical protein